jgi:hypothetical protein
MVLVLCLDCLAEASVVRLLLLRQLIRKHVLLIHMP